MPTITSFIVVTAHIVTQPVDHSQKPVESDQPPSGGGWSFRIDFDADPGHGAIRGGTRLFSTEGEAYEAAEAELRRMYPDAMPLR